MPQGYTLDELKAMGKVSKDYQPPSSATPVVSQGQKGYTLQELQDMGKVSKSYVPHVAQEAQTVIQEPQQKGGVLSAIGNFGIGAAKGVGETLAGASTLGEKMFRGLGAKGVGPTAMEQYAPALEAKGTAQKLGKGAERIAEFFVPGAAPAKAASALSKGLKVARIAEEAPGLLRAGRALGRTAVRSGIEAGVVGGQTAIQTGGEEGGSAALTAAAVVPGLKVLGATGKGLIREPERLMGKALGFTKSQISKLDKIASENGAYQGVKDFALKHGFVGSREQMAQQIDERFTEMTGMNKPETLAAIKTLIPNKFKSAFAHLQDVYDVPGQEGVLKEINALSRKKNLTAAELDRVRSLMDNSLPTGAYKGAEPVKTEGLQNIIDPMRRTLENLDKSGTIRRVNQDIRVLYQMKKAIEHAKSGGVEGAAAFRTLMRGGATQVLTALGVPLPKIATIPYVIYQGATDFPQVASYIAQKLKGGQAAIPKDIPLLLRMAIERWK